MSSRIFLWEPKPDVSSDDAGTTVLSYPFVPPLINNPAPYEREATRRSRKPLRYVPSLQAICIKQLAKYPEQMHVLGSTRLLYEPSKSPKQRDLLKELIPNFSHSSELDDIDPNTFLERVDPRLWAVLVQTYAYLPESFRKYTLPLADAHLPLLQQVPSTNYFSMATIVELPQCRDVTDHTLYRLRELPSLAALDIARTKITSWGIKTLAKTMKMKELTVASPLGPLEGPWRLRILSLQGCKKVDDVVFESLSLFPLLSVIGVCINCSVSFLVIPSNAV